MPFNMGSLRSYLMSKWSISCTIDRQCGSFHGSQVTNVKWAMPKKPFFTWEESLKDFRRLCTIDTSPELKFSALGARKERMGDKTIILSSSTIILLPQFPERDYTLHSKYPRSDPRIPEHPPPLLQIIILVYRLSTAHNDVDNLVQ